jgi:hypothetical protein
LFEFSVMYTVSQPNVLHLATFWPILTSKVSTD